MSRLTINYMKIFTFFFTPISKLWELIYKVRRFSYDVGLIKRNTYKVPIISIGNLTLGGTGKTPFTLWMGRYLSTKSKKVMVLTRGYKGKLEHSSGIIKTGKSISYNPFEFGDEALVICRGLKNASVVVGKKRSKNLKHYFNIEEPDVVLLDDGHQHLKINRNLNIVLFDSVLPIERYKAPPLGYLREGMSALQDADMVILGRADLINEEQKNKLIKFLKGYISEEIPFGSFYYAPCAIKDMDFSENIELDNLKGRNVYCISGVASPRSFYELVESLGCTIVDKFEFNDHHHYKKEELIPIIEKAKSENAIILTTEKDIVKLRRIVESDIVYFIEIEIKFLSGQEDLERLIDRVIA